MTNGDRKAYMRAYYLAHRGPPRRKPPKTPEEIKEYHRAYYLAHRGPLTRKKPSIEEERALHRAWNKAHPEVLRAAGRKWAATHPDRQAAKNARRLAAKLRATPPWLTKEDHLEIISFYTRAREQGMVVDHIVPLRGNGVSGLHVPWNLQLLTKADNQRKGNRYGPY